MEISKEIARQVGLIVNRRGVVEHVIVGTRERISLPELSSERVGRARFRGLRFVHTHLNGELLSKEDLTDLALLQLDLVACILERKGEPGELIQIGHLMPGWRQRAGVGFHRPRARGRARPQLHGVHHGPGGGIRQGEGRPTT